MRWASSSADGARSRRRPTKEVVLLKRSRNYREGADRSPLTIVLGPEPRTWTRTSGPDSGRRAPPSRDGRHAGDRRRSRASARVVAASPPVPHGSGRICGASTADATARPRGRYAALLRRPRRLVGVVSSERIRTETERTFRHDLFHLAEEHLENTHCPSWRSPNGWPRNSSRADRQASGSSMARQPLEGRPVRLDLGDEMAIAVSTQTGMRLRRSRGGGASERRLAIVCGGTRRSATVPSPTSASWRRVDQWPGSRRAR